MKEAIKDLYKNLLTNDFQVHEVIPRPDNVYWIRITKNIKFQGKRIRYRSYRYELGPNHADRYDESYECFDRYYTNNPTRKWLKWIGL